MVWNNESLRLWLLTMVKADTIIGLPEESSIDEVSVGNILAIADAFPDIEKTPMTYRDIGFALSQFNHPEAALLQMTTSLNNASSDFDRFYTLCGPGIFHQ